MFYSEEEVLPSIRFAEQLLGPSGRIDLDTFYANVCLATKKFGKIWYGDLCTSDIPNLKTLRNFVGEDVYILFNDSPFILSNSIDHLTT
jgi:hypothetical protein